MILEKRLNGLWWFYDAFYMDSFTPYPFGCIIDRSANTFVLTKENRPSYPKQPLPVADVQIRVLPSTSLETYTTAELLENRLLALGFPPLVIAVDSRPYKSYVAKFGISSTEIDAIDYINIFENTIGTISITKNGSHFFIESDSLFTENKTFVNTIGGGDSIDSILFLNESMTNSLIKLNIFGSGLNSNNHIEIRVYN